jgi:hypothetical protein
VTGLAACVKELNSAAAHPPGSQAHNTADHLRTLECLALIETTTIIPAAHSAAATHRSGASATFLRVTQPPRRDGWWRLAQGGSKPPSTKASESRTGHEDTEGAKSLVGTARCCLSQPEWRASRRVREDSSPVRGKANDTTASETQSFKSEWHA